MADHVGELAQSRGIGRNAVGNGPHDGRALARLIPIIEREREVHGPRGRLQRGRNRPHERGRHILGTRRLVRPLDPRARQHRGVYVGEPRLQQHHLAGLLARREDQRRLVLECGQQVPHRISQTSSGMEVDKRGVARGLGEPVGHRDDRGLLEPQYVAKVRREVLQERLLGRADIPEDRGQPVRTQQVEGDVSHRHHALLTMGSASLVGDHGISPVLEGPGMGAGQRRERS